MKAKKRSPEWISWHGARQRCNNKNRKDYKYYGGKGISICDEWSTFKQFLNDMGNRPTALHTLDRIESDKDYCLSNCRWATRKEQVMNQNKTIIVDGKSMSEWSRHLGVALSALIIRYRKYGKICLSHNFKPNGIEFNGEVKTLQEWAAKIGISDVGLKRRIVSWGIEKALSTKKYETRKNNKNRYGKC